MDPQNVYWLQLLINYKSTSNSIIMIIGSKKTFSFRCGRKTAIRKTHTFRSTTCNVWAFVCNGIWTRVNRGERQGNAEPTWSPCYVHMHNRHLVRYTMEEEIPPWIHTLTIVHKDQFISKQAKKSQTTLGFSLSPLISETWWSNGRIDI